MAELLPGKCSYFPRHSNCSSFVGIRQLFSLGPFFIDKTGIPASLLTLLGLGWPLCIRWVTSSPSMPPGMTNLRGPGSDKPRFQGPNGGVTTYTWDSSSDTNRGY